ncbi:hypothetical protein LUZ60_001826 [Juncus effusus]|nr:hypothetical protein LUZ60_001826 [Juncus effusus]
MTKTSKKRRFTNILLYSGSKNELAIEEHDEDCAFIANLQATHEDYARRLGWRPSASVEMAEQTVSARDDGPVAEETSTVLSTNAIVAAIFCNLDERVTEKVLHEIAIQAGRVIDIHIPTNKETNKHKGYAFVEYESAEIAEYAIKLFSGLVKLYNRPVRFAMSGQDKAAAQNGTITPPIQTPHSNYSSGLEYDRLGNEYSRRVFDSVLGDARKQHSSYRPS